MMDVQDNIVEFIRGNGPLLPSKVAKHIGTDIIIASAHLSDLASRNKVKISKLKVGSSPLYYLPGQEAELYNFAASNLNSKDYKVLEKLKENRILIESDLDLLSRVALRSLKDFAVPLQVRTRDRSELFWKWYLLSDDETNVLIKDILSIRMQNIESANLIKPNENEIPQAETDEPALSSQRVLSGTQPVMENHETRPGHRRTKMHHAESQPANSVAPAENETRSENKEEKEEKKNIHRNYGRKKKEQQKVLEALPIAAEEPKELLESKLWDKNYLKEDHPEKDEEEKIPETAENQEKEAPKSKKRGRKEEPDQFLPLIEKYFKSSEIEIEQKEIIRKHKEIDFLIKVPSIVGKMTYYCKAKQKDRCDEKDLSAAYMQAKIKELPLLFLYTNNIHKKALEMLETSAFQNAVVKKID